MAGPPRAPDDKTPPAGAPEQQEQLPWLEELPPRKIVAELDRYIVGQEVAKKAVAIAVRNRWRRSRSEEHTSELQSQSNLVCRLLLEKKNTMMIIVHSLRTTTWSMP